MSAAAARQRAAASLGRRGRALSLAAWLACAALLPPLAARAADATTVPGGGTSGEQALLDLARQPWVGDWDAIVTRRVLRVLVVYNPSMYFVDRGNQRGILYEVFKEFENDANRKLATKALRFHVAFIPVTRDDLVPALLQGRGDVAAANLTITPERARLVDFSRPVLTGVRELLVTPPNTLPLASVEALSGRELYVRRSSSYWEHLAAISARLVAAGREPVHLTPASEYLEDEDLLEMVNSALVPGIVVDSYKATLWHQVFTRIVVHDGFAVNDNGSIAWGVRPNSPKLRAALDDFIRTHGKGTLFGNIVIQDYWKSVRSLKSATSEAEMLKFRATVELFRKYGELYDLDYLLMMAQGYQESGLDQTVRSAAGAIGVMQIMPDTARTLGVGDVAQLEPNIHAGVKYIRFMVDNYYAKEPLAPLDRTLFAFAAYNAGPGRIESLREEAARRGLNPNAWFGNVEVVAADAIGQETVTYVANIYKYYVAYSLLADVERRNRSARQELEAHPPDAAAPVKP